MKLLLDRFPARTRVGVVLILVFAATTSAHWIRSTVSGVRHARAGDEISAYEARYQELRRALPHDAVVGYLSDPVPPDLPRAESRRPYQRFLLTQYALAPVIVLRDTLPELVVGDFESEAGADSAVALGLVRVRDFGNGILLMRREAR